MRRPIRLITTIVAGLGLVVGAAACGDDDEAADTTTSTAAVSDADMDEGEEPVAGCTVLQERPDGVYPAGDAGEIALEAEGGSLTVVDPRPSEGWTVEQQDDPEEVEEEAVEVEVTFRGEDEREIDVEASVTDGELVIEVCES